MGGWAVLHWAHQADGQQSATVQTPYSFRICGRNPTVADARTELKRVMPDPNYWFIEKVAMHETGMSQFCELANNRAGVDYCASSPYRDHEGFPIFGQPAGYGIVQRDPLPLNNAEQIMWNWKEAIAEGKRLVDATAGPPAGGRGWQSISFLDPAGATVESIQCERSGQRSFAAP
jgi:hypothetical protein